MADSSGRGQSFWVATVAEGAPAWSPLPGDLEVDAAIIGGGLVGLTAAQLLQRAGKRVAVLEARRVGREVTGRSTAKVTSQHGLIYQKLVKRFGEDGARTYAAANQAAIEQIAGCVRDLAIECDFERMPAYVYAHSESEVGQIRAEVETAQRLGLPAAFTRELDLPFEVTGAVRFDDQAQFNPCRYLLGLAESVAAAGGRVFEGTRVQLAEHGEPCRVVTDRGTVTARDVIMATHMPLGTEGMFFTKAYPYAHPVLAARIDRARAPHGMFISSEQPTHSIRTGRWRDETCLVAVGGAYKPGHADEERALFEDLERFVRKAFGVTSIDYRWTNEDYESMDGMPFIGRASSKAEHLFVATGFNAWGITNGTVAGMIIADLILGRGNPWAELFDATRLKPVAGGPSFLGENVSAGVDMLGGYLKRRRGSIEELAPGEAAVLKLEGERVAAFRDEQGQVHAVSAVCTHLRCILGWNPVDRTWDCPCHGSRFEIDGRVVHGPATADLERKDVSGR